MKSYVVICNAREDQPFADRLKSSLKEQGVSVWVGTSQLNSDSKYTIRVSDAIKTSSALIFISSRNSLQSSICKGEVGLALRSDVRVICVVADAAGARIKMKSPTETVKVEFREDFEVGVNSLVDEIRGTKVQPSEGGQPNHSDRDYIFLSYAEEDTAVMQEVKEFLAKRGYAYWEYQESKRDYNTDLNLELEDVIRGAKATLSILSPDWKKSKWAMKEYAFSQELGLPVFLLRFKDMGPTLAIAGIPYIDFVEDKGRGYSTLERELTQKVSEQASAG